MSTQQETENKNTEQPSFDIKDAPAIATNPMELDDDTRRSFISKLSFESVNSNYHKMHGEPKSTDRFDIEKYDFTSILNHVTNNVDLLAIGKRREVIQIILALDAVKDDILLPYMDGIVITTHGGHPTFSCKFTENTSNRIVYCSYANVGKILDSRSQLIGVFSRVVKTVDSYFFYILGAVCAGALVGGNMSKKL